MNYSSGSDRDSEKLNPGCAESGCNPDSGPDSDPDKGTLRAIKVEIDQKTQYISSWTLKKDAQGPVRILQTSKELIKHKIHLFLFWGNILTCFWSRRIPNPDPMTN
jgi:hypothetical protein